MLKVAINGFGRIGRLVFRAIHEQGLLGKEMDVVAVGDIVPADNLAYLLKYDSSQGAFKGQVGSKKSGPEKAEDDVLVVDGREIQVVSGKTPSDLPWKAMGVDLVLECTGLFIDADKAKGHLQAGAKKVLERQLHDQWPGPCGSRAVERGHGHHRRPDDHRAQLHGQSKDRRRPQQKGLALWPDGGH
jgi:glyceraldehyde-3-phosphate dehydrogenase/erythrose-4-phosphate dehydrogenase